MKSPLIDVTCIIRAKTKLALGILDEKDEEGDLIWLPLSQIEYTEPNRKGMTEITMPEWLAKDKGLV